MAFDFILAKMHRRTVCFLLFALSILFFGYHLNQHGVEYRDDEIFYYQSTQEMAQSHNYFFPTYFGEYRFQKPILFYWFVLASYKIFGCSWFGARFVAVLFAAGSVVLTYRIGCRLLDRRHAFLGCLIIVTIPLFFRHAKNVVPDMALNFFIVLAMDALTRFWENPRRAIRYMFFSACALGFLVKGFAAIIIPILTLIIYCGLTRQWDDLKKIQLWSGFLWMGLLILPWFFCMMWLYGDIYTHYMIKTETVDRLIAAGSEPFFLKLGKTFLSNSWFYVRNMFGYFAPWSIFAVVAIPWSIRMVAGQAVDRARLLFLLVWFAVVFVFFSLIFARINHLVLVLSTPFALLVAAFLLEKYHDHSFRHLMNASLRKFLCISFIGLGLFGLTFIQIFLTGASALWLFVAFFLLIGALIVITVSDNSLLAPSILGGFLIFVFFNSGMISQAGLTSHSVLQAMAMTIKAEPYPEKIIAVGDPDIHEKELQVYFSEPVRQVATQEAVVTRTGLQNLFKMNQTVYCLMLRKDYDIFQKSLGPAKIDIIQRGLICRRRIPVDRDLLWAILTLNRSQVQKYLLEEIVLLRKE